MNQSSPLENGESFTVFRLLSYFSIGCKDFYEFVRIVNELLELLFDCYNCTNRLLGYFRLLGLYMLH